MSLLTFANDAPFPAGLLDTPGAFLWWYAEMFDQQGDGIVLIWSFGLPFLPGLASGARAGVLTAPAARPSLNVAIYRGWALDGYLLREYAPDEVQWTGDDDAQRWRFQDTTLQLQDGELHAHLDLPFLGSDTVRGEVTIKGARVRRASGIPQLADAHHHVWAPHVALADGAASLSVGSARYEISGRGYVDGNFGDRPLGASLDHWSWGRIARDDHELLYYLLTRGPHVEAHLVTITSDGEVRGERAEVQQRTRRGRFGLRYPSTLRLTTPQQRVELTAGARLDDGPFYVRHQLTDDAGRCGVGEHCDVRRIDLARHRPLVRMRVHAPAANSIWLPLFCGARRDRALNLATHWVTR